VDLDELRAQLTADQRQVLTVIWRHYLKHRAEQNGGWISDRELYYAFGNRRTFVRSTLSSPPLSGSVAFEQGYGSPCTYQLTALGAFLTEDGEELEKHLVGYLTHIQTRCREDVRFKEVRGTEIGEALGLSAEQVDALFGLFILSGWFWSGGTSSGENLTAIVPQNIGEILEMDDLRAYARKHVLQFYDPNVPIDQEGRQSYSQPLARQNLAAMTRFTPSLPPDSLPAGQISTPPEVGSTMSKVFVVYGRDEQARKALFQFLRAVGLSPLEWDQIVALVGQGSPYVGDVIDKGLSVAQAVVVLLTGDDLVSLRKEFRNPNEPDEQPTVFDNPEWGLRHSR
jgi:hypothetical protein